MFKFKQFDIVQEVNSQKVGTDSMILGALTSQLRITPRKILDIGTGTGVLALMMAQSFPNANVTGVELDVESQKEAAMNFGTSIFSDRLYPACADVRNFTSNDQFDLIISNPPYFHNDLKSDSIGRNRTRHDDGLTKQELISFCSKNLGENGMGAFVYPYQYDQEVKELITKSGLFLFQLVHSVHKGEEVRSFFFFAKSDNRKKVEKRQLIVRDSDGNYSKEYIDLTKEFHYKDLSK